jgi:AP-1-like transcription factor
MQKRKAQNRAAQRAFRERKEKHLKDLEIKVDDLEKASESANHENGLLRAQVERLQVELKEYRKRLSWVSTNAGGRNSLAGPPTSLTKKGTGTDFQFEFPKFGDLPANHIFNNGSSSKPQGTNPSRSSTLPSASTWANKTSSQVVPGVLPRNSVSSSSPTGQAPTFGSTGHSPMNSGLTASPQTQSFPSNHNNSSIDSLSALFSPSIIEAGRNASFDYFPSSNTNGVANQSYRNGADQYSSNSLSGIYNSSSVSNTDSPSSSSDSHHPSSSMGTSPEPSLSSPGNKLNDFGLNTIREENQMTNSFGGETSFCARLALACGNSTNPIPPIMSESNGGRNLAGSAITPSYDPNGFNWLAQQNGGGFDPVLFREYREPQNAVVSQDFGTFFNDAFPLPDLGSPLHNFNDVAPSPLPKPDPLNQTDAAQQGEEEVVPGEDRGKLMTCNKIWFVEAVRLCSMILTPMLGTVCNRWRSSEMVKSTLTTCALSLDRRQDVLKEVQSWMRGKLIGSLARRNSGFKRHIGKRSPLSWIMCSALTAVIMARWTEQRRRRKSSILRLDGEPVRLELAPSGHGNIKMIIWQAGKDGQALLQWRYNIVSHPAALLGFGFQPC